MAWLANNSSSVLPRAPEAMAASVLRSLAERSGAAIPPAAARIVLEIVRLRRDVRRAAPMPPM